MQSRNKFVGYIPNGAIVEKEIPASFTNEKDTVTLYLKHPDITTAARISMALNVQFNSKIAKAIDPATIKVKIPETFKEDIISFLALLEEVEVDPDAKAKIVIDERTGTIVFGGNIVIKDFTISYGNFVVSVEDGKINDAKATIQNLVNALKTAGATPQDIIAIIQALSKSGYLYAEVVIM